MKQKTIFLIVFMLQFSLTTVPATIQTAGDSKDKDKDKIELKEKEKMTRSISIVEVEAHHDDSILELFVDNYTGSVTMHILSSSLCITVGINETGYVTMDISQLPEGSYTLQVVIGSAIFEGDFEL